MNCPKPLDVILSMRQRFGWRWRYNTQNCNWHMNLSQSKAEPSWKFQPLELEETSNSELSSILSRSMPHNTKRYKHRLPLLLFRVSAHEFLE